MDLVLGFILGIALSVMLRLYDRAHAEKIEKLFDEMNRKLEITLSYLKKQ